MPQLPRAEVVNSRQAGLSVDRSSLALLTDRPPLPLAWADQVNRRLSELVNQQMARSPAARCTKMHCDLRALLFLRICPSATTQLCNNSVVPQSIEVALINGYHSGILLIGQASERTKREVLVMNE
jgi:hypothetical protein